MLIATKDLKEFIKLSKPIKQNRIVPILDYIKLEIKEGIGKLTKTNLQSYCMHEIQIESKEDACILIDEAKLIALINNTSDDIISIKEKKNAIEISDDRSKITFAKENPEAYQKFPYWDGEAVELSAEILQSIGVAKNYAMDLDLPNQYSFVFSVPKEDHTFIYGAEMGAFYLKRFDQLLPAFSLTKEAATLISGFDGAKYFSAGNYDFFANGPTSYGFVKNDFTALPIHLLLNRGASLNSFEIRRDDLTAFCDTALSVIGSKLVPSMTVSLNNDGLLLSCKQDGMDVDLIADIPVRHTDIQPNVDEIEFTIKTLSRALKGLPYEFLTIKLQDENEKKGFILSHPEDTTYYGLIMGIGVQ